MRAAGKISEDVKRAYVTLRAIYYNQIVLNFGEEAAALTRDPLLLDPHLNNVSYLPLTGKFVVFDFD